MNAFLGRSRMHYLVMNVALFRLAGKRNGELLTLAEAAGFDVLLTVDKGLPHQQNLSDRVISLLVVRAHSNEIEDLLPHVPACLEALRSIKPGQVVRVG